MNWDDDETVESKLRELLEPQAPLVFLSYAKEDENRVKAIYRKLRTEHLNPWLDVADLLPGQEWDKIIISTIRSARFVIVFLSNRSVNKRGYVQKEIKEALDAADKMPEGDIFIIPVRLEECIVPERLSRWQWVDVFRPHGFMKLVHTLKENLDSETGQITSAHINAKIVVLGATDNEASFQLNKIVSLIGRSTPGYKILPDIDLERFNNSRAVSRSHALIIRVGNSFIIKDCGSSNGTIINDSIILGSNQTRILKAGDKLRLGNMTLYFITYG